MESSYLPARIEPIVCRPEEDGAFLLNPDTGNISYINRTALEVYKLIDGQNDFGVILDIFTRRYPETDSQKIQADIAAILDSFAENQFIATS